MKAFNSVAKTALYVSRGTVEETFSYWESTYLRYGFRALGETLRPLKTKLAAL